MNFRKVFGRHPRQEVAARESVRRPAYEARADRLYPLSAVLTMVPRHQEEFFQESYFELGASLSLVVYAHSDPPQEIMEYLGADQMKKSLVVSIGRSEFVQGMLARSAARFSTSERTRGIAISLPIWQVAGVAAYKFLSDESRDIRLGVKELKRGDTGREESQMSDERARMSSSATEGDTAPYELIFAIVNKGYTDLVMDASRRAGARGGTIVSARGTGNPEMEKYYGFSITPDKEIVMILVERKIVDAVLKSIYDAAGLSTNGQGIMFAMPAGRVCGMTAKPLPSQGEKPAHESDDGEYK